MRKRTIKFTFDKVLWLFLMLLPLFLFCIQSFNFGIESITMTDVFTSNLGFNMANDNILLTSINQVFGETGILPLWTNSSFIPYYISYLAVIVLVQIFYDVMIFIPKLAHKWMHAFTQDEE